MLKGHTHRRNRTRAGTALILGGALLLVGNLLAGRALPDTTPGGDVLLLSVKSTINPAISDYVAKGLKQAAATGSECVILELDTPGGLDTAMRDIIQAILNSPVPVVAYVAPSGARAASAGAVITFAAHVAAMAPGTNIGAAHPVGLGEGKMDETMLKKVENDAAAFAKSLAEQRGRNVDWAVKAVRESASVSAVRAVELHVVDLMAASRDDLLASLDGREVKTLWGVKKLEVKGKPVVEFQMGWRYRLLDVLSNPNIAYLLMMLGFYGLFFELSNPGVIFPGVFGAICLILAFFALQTLPVNYAGILLILLAIILFIAEVKVTSYGVLTLGGIISMILGSLMLFESPESYLRVSWYVLLPTALLTAGFFVFALSYVLKAQLAKPTTGVEGLVGMRGKAITTLNPRGKVFVHGEYWNAESDEEIGEGEGIEVTKVCDLTLKVKRSRV
jgi:membrane-bound serine protease (ClpP class)